MAWLLAPCSYHTHCRADPKPPYARDSLTKRLPCAGGQGLVRCLVTRWGRRNLNHSANGRAHGSSWRN